ncbi:MAG TPA: TonB-dependent receptor [Verrucomicrobiota bacterium]|nr:TonB-dependent receptor [Verrucomicrobiota bacterium]
MKPRQLVPLTAGLGWLLLPTAILGDEPIEMERIVIYGRADSLLEIADAASEGYVGRDVFEYRPLLRPGELLETVPGLIATQHSGNGKANQYFLRGFNLDHGTDFATFVDGVPINLPTHAHGQGYTDINFMIPELVERIHFRKGPYYADLGDFSSVGAVNMKYSKSLNYSLADAEGGMYGYARGLFISSPKVGDGNLLYAAEYQHDNGPWDLPSNYNKANGVMSYSKEKDGTGWSITGMGYYGRWDSTDQIPRRAVDEGLIGRFGNIDDSDGGESKRFSLSAEWHRDTEEGHTRVMVYGVYYDLDLFSNFTYFLDDPYNGDQFQQYDQRVYGGLMAHHTWNHQLFGRTSESTVGLQVRGDDIHVELNHTRRREFLETNRSDDVGEVYVAPYVQNQTRWTDKIRSDVGVRLDNYHFGVESYLPEDTGNVTDSIVSPKGSVVFGPWANTEFNLSAGMGFHSNDARGVTSAIDPADPLVRTYGAETGVRTLALDHLQSTVTFWWLQSDSELVFVGDAGSTEATRPSERYGVEFANYYTPMPWLTFDLDFAWSHARYSDYAPEGNFIPGAIETVLSAGVTAHDIPSLGGFFSSLRLRYFGPRPLTENDEFTSDGTAIVNLQVGYQFNARWKLTVDVFNLFNSKGDDITYYYPSRLPGEPAEGVDDYHFHPVEPIQVRAGISARF